jgi:hypothetical protein
MLKHKVKLNLKDSIQFKPKKNIGSLNNNIVDTKEVTIKELSDLITQPYAHIFTPHYFDNDRSQKSWKSQSIYYLDFDNGTTLDNILKRLSDLSLRPNIIYNTLSDTIKLRKFRVVFFLNGVTEDYDTAFWIQSNLVKMFPDSDQKCSTVERMVYPGFSVQYLDENENSFDDFIRVINVNLIANDSFHTRKIKDIEIDFDDTNDFFNIRLLLNKSKQNIKENIENLPEPIQINKNKFSEMISNIKILNDFNSGMKLSHMEIFGLATNFKFIHGGLSYMKKKMIEVNKNGGKRRDGSIKNYDDQEFAILNYVRKKNYLPQTLSKFSPHKEDNDYHNLLNSIRWKRGRIDIIDLPEKIKLNKAEQILNDEFVKIIKKMSNTQDNIFEADTTPDYIKEVTVFKVPTGLGKTRQLETVTNAILAFPTNKLKNEVSDRMKVEHYMTPDYPIFSDNKINEIIKNYIDCNLYEDSSKIVTKISLGKEIEINNYSFKPTKLDIDLALSYKEDNDLCRSTNQTVLTTHTRAIFDNNFQHDTIIFDECPLKYMIDMGKCSLDFTIFDHTEFSSCIKPIEDWFRNKLGFNYIDEKKDFTIKNYSKFAEFCAMNGRGDLIRLLDADYVYKDDSNPRNLGEVFFVIKKDIPAKNIIIMSATAPIDIYKHIFGKKLKVIDVSNVEKTGKITQYTSKSWSRSSLLKSSGNELDKLKEKIGERPVITFANFKKIFKNKLDIHFGNVEGYDDLKGKDIAVVGTDNKPLHVYFFYAKIIGMDLKGSDNKLDMRIIEWGGYRFKAMTFENEILRDIQLSLIESELIQAVGRNRNLRENCETLLFSSQPLKISDEFIY